MKKSPFPWIILLGAAVIIYFVFVFPKQNDWRDYNKTVGSIEDTFSINQQENSKKQNRENTLKEEFLAKFEEQQKLERQIFPEVFDGPKVVKILETVAASFDVMDSNRESKFDLESITLGSTNVGEDYSVSTVQMRFTADRKSMNQFIQYLRTHQLPKEFPEALAQGVLTEENYLFISGNLLPVATISNISMPPASGAAPDLTNPNQELKVGLSINFYSQ